MQVVLLGDLSSHHHAVSIVESVHSDPLHRIIVLIFLLKFPEKIFRVQLFILQYHIPCSSGIFRVYVKLAALHGRLDVRRSAAHALRQLHIQIRALLDQDLQHLSQYILLCHRFCGNVYRLASACPEYGGYYKGNTDQHCRRCRHEAVRLLRFRAAHFHAALKESEKEINNKSQNCDQQTSRHGHGAVVCRDSTVDRDAETACADKGCDTGKGDGHCHHAADPGHDHRHCQRQFDLEEYLHSGASHSFRRLKNSRIYIDHSRMCISHHREQGIYGKGNDCRGVSHAGKRNQKSQHGDRRDRIQEVDDRQRRLRRPLELTDQNSCQTAHKDCNHNGEQGYLKMLQKKPCEKVCPLCKQCPYFFYHFYSPLLMIACTGQFS